MALSEDALYACYRRMEKPLYNVLYRWLWQAQECQDTIHDAFVRIWEKRARVDEARLEKLVWTTALNLARNRLRWRSLWRFAEIEDSVSGEDGPFEASQRHERDARLRSALARLPNSMRQVLLLAEFGGLGIAEIAEVLGIPPGTVGSRKHQALVRLRAELKEETP
jgi:RNA polymerase sigma-70 factor (ECF subfamily)